MLRKHQLEKHFGIRLLQLSFLKKIWDKQHSPEDALLCTTLVNMHYGRCTPNDIVFLRSQISGEKMVSPMLLPRSLKMSLLYVVFIHKKIRLIFLDVKDLPLTSIRNWQTFILLTNGEKKESGIQKTKISKSISKTMHSSTDIEYNI